MDFISQLPESILHDILNRLPTKDVARTCILSKAWNMLQSRTPFLRFKRSDFASASSMLSHVEKHLDRRFSNNNEIVPIFSFHLNSTDFNFGNVNNNYRLYSLLKLVMNRGQTQILDLDMLQYRFPSFVLHSNTLTKLILFSCECDYSSSAEIRLPNLTTIDIKRSNVYNKFVEQLVSGCHILQHLKIHQCYCLTTLRVTCLERLETVDIMECKDLKIVEIMSPNLHCIRFYGWELDKLCDLAFSPAKKLIMDKTTIRSSFLQQQLSTCEELRLRYINCIGDINISSQMLRKLQMKYVRMKSMAQINCPNLHSLVCVSNQLPLLCEHKSLCDVRIEIFKEPGAHQNTFWCDQLKDLFRISSIKQAIIYDGKEMIILDGVRTSMIPKQLFQCERVVISSISNSRQLNNLVKWVCTSIRCSKIYVASTENNFSQVIFDKLSRIKEAAKIYDLHCLTNVSKDSATNTIPAALRSFDQYQITTIMLEFTELLP